MTMAPFGLPHIRLVRLVFSAGTVFFSQFQPRFRPANGPYEVYVREQIQMEGDPTSFEEAMRSVYSFEWQEAIEVEMNLMNINDV